MVQATGISDRLGQSCKAVAQCESMRWCNHGMVRAHVLNLLCSNQLSGVSLSAEAIDFIPQLVNSVPAGEAPLQVIAMRHNSLHSGFS